MRNLRLIGAISPFESTATFRIGCLFDNSCLDCSTKPLAKCSCTTMATCPQPTPTSSPSTTVIVVPTSVTAPAALTLPPVSSTLGNTNGTQPLVSAGEPEPPAVFTATISNTTSTSQDIWSAWGLPLVIAAVVCCVSAVLIAVVVLACRKKKRALPEHDDASHVSARSQIYGSMPELIAPPNSIYDSTLATTNNGNVYEQPDAPLN